MSKTNAAEGSLIHVTSVEAVRPADIKASLAQHGVACLRGLFGAEEIAAARAVMARNFSAERDQPSQGEPPGAVMRNFQKLAVGGNDQAWVYNPRFVRVLYNPLWCEDVHGMHAIFRRFARLRNHLLGRPADFAIDRVEDRLWTASRLQQYPAGGGFMGPHRDVVLEKVERDSGLGEFYQLLLLLTTKGRDFETGGAYVEKDGTRLHFEDWCGAGDVVVYDGASLHGVADVDPHRRLDLTTLNGRIVAMVSLYKDMSGDKTLYEGYDRGETGRQSFPTGGEPGR